MVSVPLSSEPGGEKLLVTVTFVPSGSKKVKFSIETGLTGSSSHSIGLLFWLN